MLVPQQMGPQLSGRTHADIIQWGSHPHCNSSRPVARRASLRVSAFESQTQPWSKSSASSSRYISRFLYGLKHLWQWLQAFPDDIVDIESGLHASRIAAGSPGVAMAKPRCNAGVQQLLDAQQP